MVYTSIFTDLRIIGVLEQRTRLFFRSHSLSGACFLCTFRTELSMSIKKTVEIKLEMIWYPSVEMKICFVPVCVIRDPTNELCNLKYLQTCWKIKTFQWSLENKDHKVIRKNNLITHMSVYWKIIFLKIEHQHTGHLTFLNCMIDYWCHNTKQPRCPQRNLVKNLWCLNIEEFCE